MTTKKRKRSSDPSLQNYGPNAQKFKELLEIGFEVMSYEMPFSLEEYGAGKFQLDGQIGFGLCQLSFEVHDKQTCEETRLVCFEKGIYFDTGAILPFGIAPKDPPEGTYYREQTPENLAIMIFASIVTRRPCRPEGCGCQSKHEMHVLGEMED